MFSNTKESGLESLIVKWLVEQNHYEQGHSHDYSMEYALDTARLLRFLKDTQPEAVEKLQLETHPLKRAQFLSRVRDEITKRGIIDVLRKGVKVYPASLVMFYMTPSVNNPTAAQLYAKNIFSVTRQLHFSPDATKLSLDLCIFINGLPVITFELKNQLTKQNVDDAVYQYQHDRSSKELLFQFTRCMVHFAVDDAQVKFCTRLQGKESWFLPFNKGYKDGAGNPPNPDGLMTDYLWKQILTKEMLSRIIENYAALIEEKDEETGKPKVQTDFSALSSTDGGGKPAGGRQSPWRRQAVSDPAQRGKRQIQLDCMAGAPAHRAGGCAGESAGGFRHCGHRSRDSG